MPCCLLASSQLGVVAWKFLRHDATKLPPDQPEKGKDAAILPRSVATSQAQELSHCWMTGEVPKGRQSIANGVSPWCALGDAIFEIAHCRRGFRRAILETFGGASDAVGRPRHNGAGVATGATSPHPRPLSRRERGVSLPTAGAIGRSRASPAGWPRPCRGELRSRRRRCISRPPGGDTRPTPR